MSHITKIVIAVIVVIVLVYLFLAFDIPYRKDYDTLQNATSSTTPTASTSQE